MPIDDAMYKGCQEQEDHVGKWSYFAPTEIIAVGDGRELCQLYEWSVEQFHVAIEIGIAEEEPIRQDDARDRGTQTSWRKGLKLYGTDEPDECDEQYLRQK